MQTRQFIPYQTNVAIAPASKVNGKCLQCNIPLSSRANGQLCDVCKNMLDAIATPYFHAIQVEWWHENDVLKARKAMLLDPNYGVGGQDDPEPQA